MYIDFKWIDSMNHSWFQLSQNILPNDINRLGSEREQSIFTRVVGSVGLDRFLFILTAQRVCVCSKIVGDQSQEKYDEKF